MKFKPKATMLILLVCACFTQQSSASGFPTGKRKTLLSPYLSYFKAVAYRDADGNKFDYGNNGKYTSLTAQLYLEHGITDRLDLVAKIPLNAARFANDYQSNTNTTLTDLEVGLKYNFVRFNKNQYYLSGQALASVPLYGTNKNPVAGYGQFGTELKLMFSGNASERTYFNVEAGYRQYLGNKVGNVGQFTYLATSGLKIGKNNQLTGEFSGVSSYKSNLFDPQNLASNTAFTYVKATLGVGQRITGDNWIFAGVFHDVFNRNSGIGEGGMLTGIIRF
ncbi:hypothetical protein [Pedobacter frigidisoli]|uniref:hypothetical protein n=1 Tax=Pedobacter frigidisoli TaxID=2530455 RepID=UPI00292F46CD|nr:hypothetical protein [Pedobacter frigidisoli]